MTNKYEILINAFEIKVRKLISNYASLKEQNDLLKAELARKQEDLMQAHQEVLQLRKNVEHLQIAKSMVGSDEEKADSKRRISKMVREIDKCIALLDE
jgi:multidrug resistance efflux pump